MVEMVCEKMQKPVRLAPRSAVPMVDSPVMHPTPRFRRS